MVRSLDEVQPHPLEKGHHMPVEHPYIFVDSCVQIWPDTDFTRLHTYGVTAYAITAWRPYDGIGNAVDEVANWYRIAATYPNIRIAYTARDIVEAKQQNQAAIIINTQCGDFVGQNLWRMHILHRLGLRIMIPAYNNRSPIADGCLEPANSGLSRLGRQWVEVCNSLGVLIDMTHTGERSTLEIMDLTQKPAVFSHSNPKALVDNPRNITDEQIKKCAATGGIIAPTNWGPLNFKKGSATRPTVEDYVNAVDYVVQMVGIDHVGIGTDMSHGTYPDGDLIRGRPSAVGGSYASVVEASPRSKLRYVEGFDDYGKILRAVEAFERRGYKRQDIEKILGGNYLRVFSEVWGG